MKKIVCIILCVLSVYANGQTLALARVLQDKSQLYITSEGKLAIDKKYENAHDFSEGFASVWIKDRWNVIDHTGKIIFALDSNSGCQGTFSGSLMPVFNVKQKYSVDPKKSIHTFRQPYGFVDKQGHLFQKTEYAYVSEFSEGLSAVNIGGYYKMVPHLPAGGFPTEGGKWGFIDAKEKFIMEPQFEAAQSFSEGLAAVRSNNKWGYIDKNGKTVIPFVYDSAGLFMNGIAWVKKNGHFGFINKEQKKITEFIYIDLRVFHEDFAAIKNKEGSWNYIDKNGKTIVQEQFENASSFYEGLAGIMKNGKWGFINGKGTIVIDFLFEETRNFSNGLAAVKSGGKWGYINKKGDWVVKPEFDLAWDFKSDLIKR